MNKAKYLCTIVLFIVFTEHCLSQNLFLEGGLGIGNIIGSEHRYGKAEIHINIHKVFKFGELGLDFSSGGNFIPLSQNTIENNTEMISSSDSKFNSAVLLYRLPIKKYFFIESRIGYSSLNAFVHTDDKTKITQSNLTAGIGLGGRLTQNVSLSLRYQYFGKTQEFEGFSSNSNMIVKSNAESISMILLRASYRFRID